MYELRGLYIQYFSLGYVSYKGLSSIDIHTSYGYDISESYLHGSMMQSHNHNLFF